MSAIGSADATEQEEYEDDEAPGLWLSFGTALRLIVGWFCVAIGILNLLVELDRSTGQPDGPYLTFHFVFLIGGIVLLALAFINPRPGLLGYVTGAIVTLAGMIAGAIPATTTICCMSAFAVRHGFPFTFAARHDAADRWHVDSQHTLADLMFWAYLGFLVLIVVSLFRREPEEDGEDDVGPPAEERLYIERPHGQHERDPREPGDRIVGPLP
jgi:hypothetical protein